MSTKARLEAIREHLAIETSGATIAIEEQAEAPPIAPGRKLPQTRMIFPPLELEDHPIEEGRRLRVVVVGAGISGITSAVLLPAKVPNIDLIIYEHNPDVVSNSVIRKSDGVRSHL